MSVVLNRHTLGALVIATFCSQPIQLSALQTTVDAWRTQNERAILDEFFSLLSIPNVSTDSSSIRQNADLLSDMFTRRGFAVETTEWPGAPLVVARLDQGPALGTMALYIHYDGQPVDPAEWLYCGPFDPCLVTPAGTRELDEVSGSFDDEWRVYGRSASDDKGPIIALLNAVDALRATGREPAWNLRVILDGEEEVGGSANFRRFMAERGEGLGADLAITLDGPQHPSGRPTIYHGVRGEVTVRLTVFTASADLHSGNYGNWAPDPSIGLAHLLTSMKDEEGNILLAGFYDDVIPLTPAELEALEAIPNVETSLAETFGIARPEQASERLEVKLNQPTLNVLAMGSGGGLSRPALRAIPAWAAAEIQMRLVNGLDPVRQTALMVEHVRRQGYHVVTDRDPTVEERLRYPLLARISSNSGTRATRVTMESRLSAVVTEALTVDGTAPVRITTLGGTVPFSEFSEDLGIPTVGVSLVNHDNNQHGPNENLRLGNLWQSIELLSRILLMPR